MIVIFTMGIIAGVMIVIGLLRLTAATEPTGCVLAFGSILCLLILILTIVL